MLCHWATTAGRPPTLTTLYVLHRWYWMCQSHTWQPLSMCHQHSVKGRPENSLHQERYHAEGFSQSEKTTQHVCDWGIQYHLCSAHRGLWGSVVLLLSWLSGRALTTLKCLGHTSSFTTLLRKAKKGAVLVCEWLWILTRPPNTELLLEQRKQIASSVHLRWKCYFWKSAKFVTAVSIKWDIIAADNSFKKVVVVRNLDSLFQPSYTLLTQITPLLLPKDS